jgi:hypothetical protein
VLYNDTPQVKNFYILSGGPLSTIEVIAFDLPAGEENLAQLAWRFTLATIPTLYRRIM